MSPQCHCTSQFNLHNPVRPPCHLFLITSPFYIANVIPIFIIASKCHKNLNTLNFTYIAVVGVWYNWCTFLINTLFCLNKWPFSEIKKAPSVQFTCGLKNCYWFFITYTYFEEIEFYHTSTKIYQYTLMQPACVNSKERRFYSEGARPVFLALVKHLLPEAKWYS